MVSKNNGIVNLNAAAKISVRPRKNTAEGGCGGNSAMPSQKIEASSAPFLFKPKHPKKKHFFFNLRRKKRAPPNQEKRRKLFCWVASASERRRAGFLSSVQRRFAQSV